MVSGSNKCDHRQGGNHKQRDRRAKILPIVLLLALFALTIWRLRHSLPTYVYAALADPRLMDHDTPNQVTNISTFVPLLYLRHNSLPPAKDTNTTITAKVTSKLQTPLPEVQEKAHDENNDLRKVNVTKDPKILREEFEIACNHNDIKSLNRKGLRQLLYGHLNAMFVPPATLEALMGEEDPVQPCMYTFLDLGANIGKGDIIHLQTCVQTAKVSQTFIVNLSHDVRMCVMQVTRWESLLMPDFQCHVGH
jgi:hypothetical protein